MSEKENSAEQYRFFLDTEAQTVGWGILVWNIKRNSQGKLRLGYSTKVVYSWNLDFFKCSPYLQATKVCQNSEHPMPAFLPKARGIILSSHARVLQSVKPELKAASRIDSINLYLRGVPSVASTGD